MLKGWCGGPFLQNIRIDEVKPSDRENEHSLIICLLDKSAWMLWTTGNENFPSAISSAKPLVEEYLK